MSHEFPYLAKTILRYKSPHKTDLSFEKGETVRVTGPSPDDEEWLVGESLDGSRSGGFPREFVEVVDLKEEASSAPKEVPVVVAESSAPSNATQKQQEAPVQPPRTEESTASIPLPAAIPPSAAPASAPTPKSPSIATKPLPPSASGAGTEEEPAKLSFKEKMAAFNRTAGSGPPPIKPKPAGAGGPGTWSWKQKQAQGAGQANVASESTPSSDVPSSQTHDSHAVEAKSIPEPSAEAKGMSASDAKDSIARGGSLKERMAALQGAGAFGSPSGAVKSPPPVAAKPKTWKRPEPAARMEEGQPMVGMLPQVVRSMSGDGTLPTAAEGATEPEQEGKEQPLQDDDEEAREKERRAAIAARMRRLGGRGMMGGVTGGSTPSDSIIKSPVTENPPSSTPAEAVPENSVEEKEAPIEVEEKLEEVPLEAASPPTSIKLPSVPRRAAAPKKRAPARAGSAVSATSSTVSADDDIPVVFNERETPIPETEEQVAEQHMLEEAGKSTAGATGAAAAGIALEPLSIPPTEVSSMLPSPDSGEEDSTARNAGEPIVSHNPAEADEEELKGPTVPLHQQREETEEDKMAVDSPNPPPRQSIAALSGAALLGLPKDEVEMKHDQDAAAADVESTSPVAKNAPALPSSRTAASAMMAQEDDGEEEEGDEDWDDEPPPPPPVRPARPSVTALALGNDALPLPEDRRVSTGKPMGPRPMPGNPSHAMLASPTGEEADDVPIPASRGIVPEEQAELPPPPVATRRRQSIPPSSPKAEAPPIITTEPIAANVEPLPSAEPEEAEAERRKGIAARMAKLGGFKFGQMPPPVARKPTAEVSPAEPKSDEPQDIGAEASQGEAVSKAPPPAAADVQQGDDEDESEEAATKRRQSTLARLRAGGALGFGMFNRQDSQVATEEVDQQGAVDQRGLQVEPEGQERKEVDVNDEDEDEAPPPPPIARPAPTPRGSVDPALMRELPAVPKSKTTANAPEPGSPIIELANQRRASMSPIRRKSSIPSGPSPAPLASPMLAESPYSLMEEPTAITTVQGSEGGVANVAEESEDTDALPPPPPSRVRGPSIDATGQMHRRSMSVASRTSSISGAGSASASSTPVSQVTRTSISQNRPNYIELKDAAANYGKRVHQAASRLGDHGKKQIGDGDARALVWAAMSDAGLDANTSFGTLILEQNGPSVLRRMDEPRPGDIVVLSDVKLKGKKGLHSYTQAAGSVEIPVFAICSEFETKKTKVKVWQVEQGHTDTASYRLDDLKTGNVKIFRPMP